MPPSPPIASRRTGLATAMALSLLLGACAAEGPVVKVMEAVGLKKPEAIEDADAIRAELAKRRQPRALALRIHAGAVMNTDAAGRPLSLVVRVYKLRATEAFLKAPYEAYAAAPGARPDFEQDVVQSREVVLTPGKVYEVTESMPPEAPYLGIVALFRAPADGRWRYAFDGRTVAEGGIVIGLHACAASVASGTPVGTPSPEQLRVAGIRCPG